MPSKEELSVAKIRTSQILNALSYDAWKTIQDIAPHVTNGGEHDKIWYLLERLISKNLVEKKGQRKRETVISRVVFSNAQVYRSGYKKK